LIYKQTEAQATSDVTQPTQDGGNSSRSKVLQLGMRKERSWKFKEELILKIETLESTLNKISSINNGTLSMLMNGKENQLRDNSMKDSDSMLRETSMFNLLFQETETLT
jgi:hypothetical protein